MPVLEPKPSLTRAHTQTQMKGMCVAANVAKLCIGRSTPNTQYGSVPIQGKKHVGGKGTIWVGNVLKKNLGEDMSKKGTTPGPRNLADIDQFF